MTTPEPSPRSPLRQRPCGAGTSSGSARSPPRLLSGLAGDKLSQSLDSGGWISVAGLSLTIGFALIWAIYNAPVGLRRYRSWRAAVPRQYRRTAGSSRGSRAVDGLARLGRGRHGCCRMVRAERARLRERCWHREAQDEHNADDLARICDALDAWYVRQRAARRTAGDERLPRDCGHGCGRRDLEELAAARAATAYRLMGDLESANTRLGNSGNIAPARRGTAGQRRR